MKYIPGILLAALLANTASAQLTQPGFKDFDVAPGLASSTPKYLLSFNGKLYFYGANDNSGREPHSVQGQGTPMILKNIADASKHSISNNYMKPNAGMNGKYYFTACNGASGEEMFVYDGTNEPKLVANLTFSADSSKPDNYVVLNNKLYFTATVTEGQEMYMYDGSATPQRITDINTGAESSVFGPMAGYNGKIYFVGKTATDGAELWMLDPVTNTPTLVADINSGAASSDPANFTLLGGKLYFSAQTATEGRELYVYGGSGAPKRLTDISAGGLSSLLPVHSNAFALFNNKVYFSGRDTSGQQHVYSYNPADDAVTLEFKINPNGSSDPREFAVYNNRLFFTVDDGANGYELYAYDGTNTPAIIGDLCPGINSSIPQELTVIGDELYFSANNCNNSGVDLFSYNYKRVGIRNTLFDGQVEVFPNPVQRDLNIHLTLKRTEKLHVRLADVTGKNIYDPGMLEYSSGKNKLEIPMRNLPSGNYIYYVTNAEGTTYVTGKVTKQ